MCQLSALPPALLASPMVSRRIPEAHLAAGRLGWATTWCPSLGSWAGASRSRGVPPPWVRTRVWVLTTLCLCLFGPDVFFYETYLQKPVLPAFRSFLGNSCSVSACGFGVSRVGDELKFFLLCHFIKTKHDLCRFHMSTGSHESVHKLCSYSAWFGIFEYKNLICLNHVFTIR